MKNELTKLFDREINQSVANDYRKLIGFVDAAIAQAFRLSGDDRAEFLVKNMLSMRDFMSSEIVIERAKIDVKDNVMKMFDDFVSDCDLDLEELQEIRRKKKEDALKEEQQQQESLLETDPSIL